MDGENNGKPLFFNGWFGGKTPLFSETSNMDLGWQISAKQSKKTPEICKEDFGGKDYSLEKQQHDLLGGDQPTGGWRSL